MLKTAVLVSGGGTNLQSILDNVASGKITNTEISVVISSNRDAYALVRAEKAGVPHLVISPKDYPTQDAFAEALIRELQQREIGLVVLAGYLTILPLAVIDAYPNKIINIHPSLIPAFCGKGFYGLKVHERVLERGVKVTGATVHFVDEVPDGGPIILQSPVLVADDDTPQSLQEKVMEQAEWRILPKAINLIANDGIEVVGKTTRLK